MNPFKYLVRGYRRIIKLYRWNILIWNDYDFDHSYLLKVIQLKLQMMEPCIRDGWALEADKTADEIKETLVHLNKLIEDDFMNNWKELDEKYGLMEFKLLQNGNSTIERSGVTEENKEEYYAVWKLALDADYKEKEQTKRKFFNQLKKYETFWD